MAETVRSELPNLWRSINEPHPCRHVYRICPKLKAGSRGSRALVARCARAGSAGDFRLWHPSSADQDGEGRIIGPDRTRLMVANRCDWPEAALRTGRGKRPRCVCESPNGAAPVKNT